MFEKVTMSHEELLKEIQSLTGEEKIFLDLKPDDCKKLLYLNLQKKAFRNLFMSYLNATSEEVNFFNLEQFLQRWSDVNVEEYETVKQVAVECVGVENFRYLINIHTSQNFYIDMEREVLIIHLAGNGQILEGCQCDSTCKIE